VICASTGIAAVLIGGCTVHCALGLQLKMNPAPPSPAQIEAWSEVGVIFVDEFSMIKQDMFALMDSRLRELKCRDAPFGGVHLCLSADLYQLPPVAGTLISTLPKMKRRQADKAYLGELRGHTLWRESLTDVIELTENHRQTDVKYAESLTRWRINQPLQKDIDAVNSRYMEGSGTG
jgi:hypothetical protein